MKNLRAFWIGFFLSFSFILMAQSPTRKELENQRKKINKEILQVNKLLFDTQKKGKSALEDLRDINQKINVRERLINTITLESKLLNNEIAENENQLRKLSNELSKMQKDYGEMIYKSYKSKSQQSKTLFILSSKSFYQAYKRLEYMKQYALFRKKQGEEVQQKSKEVNQLKDSLVFQKKLKDTLLSQEIKEKIKIEVDKKGQEKIVTQIKRREDKYKKELQKKQKEERELSLKIDKLIKEEIAKANAKAGSKNTTKFALTPEARELANKFEQNKGKLPWPVESGLVVRKFGLQPHPTLKGITIKSSGLHIVTNNNTNAECIFNGEVFSVLTLAQGKQSVMVRHGNYISAYNNLEEVYVNKGDKVITGQALGKIFTDKITGKTKLVFVLFKDTERLNPSSWILQR